MTRSDAIADLTRALVLARVAFSPLKKTRTANVSSQKGSYQYAYASLDEVYEATVTALGAQGLVTLHNIETTGDRIGVSTLLLHTSGQWLQTDPVWLPAGVTPQSTGSAISYARRYSLQATLGVAAEDDDDGQRVDAKPTAKAKEGRDRASRAAVAPTGTPPPEGQGRTVPSADVISDKQRTRLWTLARKAEWSDDDVKSLIERFGYESSKSIRPEHYEAIVEAIETGELPEEELQG